MKKYKIIYQIKGQTYSYEINAKSLQHCRNLVFYKLKTEILESIKITEIN